MDSFILFADAQAAGLTLTVRLLLSTMNFLEFAIWGAWIVVLGQYLNSLGFSGKSIGRIYATMSLGAILAPMIIGSIADRYFASQWVMAVLHLLGAALLYWMAHIRTPTKFYWVTLLYALVYSPTLALSNSVVFANVPSGMDFPSIRVLGTIGWIAANLFLKVLLKPGEPVNNRPILLAAGLSFILGVFSFFLPNTPPKAASAFPFWDAIQLLQQRDFAIFFGVSFFIGLALAFYYSFTSLFLEQEVRVRPDNVGPLMTIGQWAEIFFLLALPWFIDKLGMRSVLILGMAAWGVRYAIFTAGRPFALILLGLVLHGICFDFFFAAGFIHVNNTVPAELQASGQSLFTILTYGLGMYLGTEAAGWLNHLLTKEVIEPGSTAPVKKTNWRMFWLIPCIGVIVSLILFVMLFDPGPPAKTGEVQEGASTTVETARVTAWTQAH